MPGTGASEKSVDDYLGPGDQRFFSAGYRRVGYLFGNVAAETANDCNGLLTTNIRLNYPGDWSRKVSRGALRPHLSTIDAIMLAAQLGELYLTHAYQFDDEARKRLWVRALRIRAGATPDEELESVPLTIRPVTTDDSGTTVVLDARIGAMRARCEIAGVVGEPVANDAVYAGPEELLGPAENRYYGTGFTRRGHRVDELSFDVADRSATALVSYTGESVGDAGLGGAYQPTPTMIDLFATSLQLAQILLYETDGMSRGESNTLWMRGTDLLVSDPQCTLVDGEQLHTSLRDLDLLTMNGALWRTADIHGRLGPVSMRCAVAHALPATTPSAAHRAPAEMGSPS